jgi:hypothetical protein
VIAVYPGGPAAKYGHGIRVGDEVLKVNGVDIKLKPQDEVRAWPVHHVLVVCASLFSEPLPGWESLC